MNIPKKSFNRVLKDDSSLSLRNNSNKDNIFKNIIGNCNITNITQKL